MNRTDKMALSVMIEQMEEAFDRYQAESERLAAENPLSRTVAYQQGLANATWSCLMALKLYLGGAGRRRAK